MEPGASLSDLRDELRTIEQYLQELPPHAEGGHRDRLDEQRVQIQRRIAAIEAGRDR